MHILRWSMFPALSMLSCVGLAGCERQAAPEVAAPAADTAPARAAPAPAAAFTWPASLKPFGEGYPDPGNPCRRVGESAAVADLLDHTRVLVGCPGRADEPAAAAVLADGQGKALAYIDGVTLIAVPPNASM